MIPAETFTIADLNPATWAQNGENGGRGHAIVKDYAVGPLTAGEAEGTGANLAKGRPATQSSSSERSNPNDAQGTVDGDFKSTKFFPKPHNCLFIYGWAGEQAFTQWLGSSLGRPFMDLLFGDPDNKAGDEHMTLETSPAVDYGFIGRVLEYPWARERGKSYTISLNVC